MIDALRELVFSTGKKTASKMAKLKTEPYTGHRRNGSQLWNDEK